MNLERTLTWAELGLRQVNTNGSPRDTKYKPFKKLKYTQVNSYAKLYAYLAEVAMLDPTPMRPEICM